MKSASYAAHNARNLDGAGGYWIASDADRNASPLTFFLQVCQNYTIRVLLFFCIYSNKFALYHLMSLRI